MWFVGRGGFDAYISFGIFGGSSNGFIPLAAL